MKKSLSIQKRSTYFIAQCLLFAFTFSTLVTSGLGQAGRPPAEPLRPKHAESPEQWLKDGKAAVAKAKGLTANRGHAKNVILFVGDGMGITTITAARILEGQLRKESGEENSLSFEEFPHLALSKTYSANQQTSDSAPTMTAMVTGVKANDGALSVNQRAARSDHTTVEGNKLQTILELAEAHGLSTGVVSTARITHATPAACYAHSPDRDWESDYDIEKFAHEASKANRPELARRLQAASSEFPDIARQLIEFSRNTGGLEVALGGGRSKFLHKDETDPEDKTKKGKRLDHKRNLIEEWKTADRNRQNPKYIWNKEQFDKVIPRETTHLLGLFESEHMEYEHDRRMYAKDPDLRKREKEAGEPSLTEMTTKAIDILSKNPKGYFLMVEAGRIDHAHHDSNAYRALTETIELSNAVRAAQSKTNPGDTLIIVTADHSHVFTMAGYPTRGNNILGLVRSTDERTGELEDDYARDDLSPKLPYTTLGYANGPGYTGESDKQGEGSKHYEKEDKDKSTKFYPMKNRRPDLSGVENINPTDPNYLQESILPRARETHGGEDVAIFADGPGAYLFHGVQEQNYIFHVMYEALNLSRRR